MDYNEECCISLKQFFQTIFGQAAWDDLKHCRDLNSWKKYCSKSLNALKVAADATVDITDPQWVNDYTTIIDHGLEMISNAKDFENLYSCFAACLGEISLLQLGMVPRRSTAPKVTLHKSYWKLNRYRTVQYVQTTEQQQNSD